MERIYKSLIELIGNTPLLEVSNIEREEALKARLLVKVESFNPGGSVKDRAAYYMIEDAEKRGVLTPGALIIEPTSGNTGIGLAWVASLKALGASIVLTPGAEGMSGAIRKAMELKNENPGSVILQQFDNKANPASHENTTAEEIWRDTDGKVDVFVSAVGTGGTVSGTGRGLKKHNRDIEVVAVEPEGSPVLEGGKPGPHKIQGIGAGFIPENYYAEVVDRVMAVSDDDAIRGSRILAQREGLLVGISSGAAFSAALKLAKKPEYSGKTIVVLLPDTGERYLSTVLYAFDSYPL